MAYRRKRITFDQIDGFLTRLKALPIDAAQQVPTEILELPAIAQKHGLTNYDAAYLELAMRFRLPLATTDAELRRAAAAAGVAIVSGEPDRQHPNWQHGLAQKLEQLLKPERLLQRWKILASIAWAIRPAAATSFRPVSQVTDVLKRSRSLSNTVLTREQPACSGPEALIDFLAVFPKVRAR
jgi:BarA-like signal transduction histidine kinase